MSIGSITELDCSDAFKSWIWHATGAKSKRYLDAFDALDALASFRHMDVVPGRAPRTLRWQCLVFSGRLDELSRTEATARARRAGARVQSRVTDSTTVIVLGSMRRGGVGAAEGIKLYGARERLRTGQPIALIDQGQFERLTRRRVVSG